MYVEREPCLGVHGWTVWKYRREGGCAIREGGGKDVWWRVRYWSARWLTLLNE